MYTQTEKVNIEPKSYLPVFRISQNDVGRTLKAHLISDDGEITIPTSATVTMAGIKPSGLGYTVTGTINGSDVTFETDATMTDEAGQIESEIRIVDGETLIGTTNVVLNVEPNPHPDDTTDGQREPLVNEITALLNQITAQADRVEEYSSKVLNMTVSAHESQEPTVVKTEGEVVNLDFGLPRGEKGERGERGERGEAGKDGKDGLDGKDGKDGKDGINGVTPDFSIGTVTTLEPNESASVTLTGTEEEPVLNFGIPKGAKGEQGDVSLSDLEKIMVTDTASGAIASFPDGSDLLPVLSLVANIVPKQDLHGYDKPWAGGAGANLLDSDYAIKFTLSKTITFSQTILSGTKVYTHNDEFRYTTPPSSGNKYPYYVFRGANNENCGQVWGLQDSSVTLSGDAVAIELWSNGYDYGASSGVEVTISGLTISKTEQTTYSPYSNICPISGWESVETVVGGVNLFDSKPYSGVGYNLASGTDVNLTESSIAITQNDNGFSYEIASNWQMVNFKTAPLKAGTYHIQVGGSEAVSRTSVYVVGVDGKTKGSAYNATGATIISTNKTLLDGEYIVVASGRTTVGTQTLITPQIELGTTTTTYDPYTATTHTTDLGRTVYGGSLDVVKGTLTVDRAMVDLGTLSWTKIGTGYITFGSSELSSVIKYDSTKPTVVCSNYKAESNSTVTSTGDNYVWVNANKLVAIKDTAKENMSVSDFKTAMNGVQLCYELSTPTTYTLTPSTINTLSGVNNVWVDSGDCSITYYADTKLYIDKKLGGN